MREIVATFGKNDVLTGVVTKPITPTAEQQNRPCVILLNAGLLHHVGPYRMSVELARVLAKSGFTVLRFDLSGLGDSQPHRDSRDAEARVRGDISDAISFMQRRYGFDRAVLMGLCTGADNAHRSAIADQRVCGAVFLDGYAYPTVGFYHHRFAPKILDTAAWGRLINQLYRKLFTSTATSKKSADEIEDENYFWSLPTKSKTVAELQTLVSRGVHLFHIYTGGAVIYNHEEQFARMYKNIAFNGQAEMLFMPESDHTFILSVDRNRLIAKIDDWMKRHFSV